MATAVADATETATPFPVASATPTPRPPQLWISPALPEPIQSQARSAAPESGYQLAADRQGADLRLEIGGDVPVGVWVYVVVAPFPTVEDGLTWDDLLAAWSGGGGFRLYADRETVEALRPRLGQPQAVETLPAESLIDKVWSESPAYAVVPFQRLDRHLKVLRLDGRSPLDEKFDAAPYPLAIEFGISGEGGLAEAAASDLSLVSTNRDPSRLTTVVLTGVTALTRATAWAIDRQGIDWAVGEAAPQLAAADITHVSHEVAFTEECPPVNPSRDVGRFCGQPEQVEVLARLGVDVVELTGNHVMDYGPEALLYTLDRYAERGWQTYGGGRDLESAVRPALFEHNGNRIAFVGCNDAGPAYAWATADGPGALRCDLEALSSQLQSLRAEGYLPIFTFQWAESYRNWPVPLQAEAFRRVAEAGAEIVSGSQAHQPQGFEFHNGTFIHYGLGNLLFDQMWSVETRQEFVDRFTFYDGRLIGIELMTWMLEDYARLRPMTSEERAQFLRTIFDASGG